MFAKSLTPHPSAIPTLSFALSAQLPPGATFMNGATCSAEGIVLDGNNDYVDIDDWEWGGATSFELYVKYDSFNKWSRVFDVGSGASSDNVFVANEDTTSTIRWEVYQGSTWKVLYTSNFDSATWTHVVVSIKDTTMKVYKNGVLVGTKTDGYEPNVLTRTQHWLGRSAWSNDGFFDGTIGFVKMWHGVRGEEEKLPDLPPLLFPTPTKPRSPTPLSSSPTLPTEYRAAHRLRRHLPVRSPQHRPPLLGLPRLHHRSWRY